VNGFATAVMRAPFTDSHVHFWDTSRLPYPWLGGEPRIAARHTPETLAREAGAMTPARIVFVEAGCTRDRALDEVRWVESLATREPRIAAIVAHAAMDSGAELAGVLAKLKNHPLVRGVRHLVQDETDPEFCTRPAFVAGVTELGRRALSFDLCCRHWQLPAVIELVRRCPGTGFILDHAGKPGIARGELDPWRGHLTTLAGLPNVVCKFSGLVTEANPTGWTEADLRPYAEHLLEAFGPSRLLFGSDWPVVKLAAAYHRWIATAESLLSSLSPAERNAIFHDNAARVYRLP
jgi:L-fuconolactonase